MGVYFIKRYQAHIKQLSKYLKYVFNDHLMILLFFLLGGAMVIYADFLKQDIQLPLIISRIIVIAISFLVTQIGNLATLFEEADNIFLLVKEQQLKKYLQRSLGISIILPIVIISIILFMMWPFVLKMHVYSKVEYLALWIGLVCLKYFSLVFQTIEGYYRTIPVFYKYLASGIFYFCSLFTHGLIFSCFLALILAISIQFYFNRQNKLLNLPFFVKKEQERMQKIYKWLNLFTDVPQIKVPVKRRKYLDLLLKYIPYHKSKTYYFLYQSQIIRGNVYGQLVIRLLLISCILMIFSQNFILGLGISSLFLFLTLLQLMPLYKELDYFLWPRLYPIDPKIREINFRNLLINLSLPIICLNILISLIIFGLKNSVIMLIVLSLIFIIFNYTYVERYLKKQREY